MAAKTLLLLLTAAWGWNVEDEVSWDDDFDDDDGALLDRALQDDAAAAPPRRRGTMTESFCGTVMRRRAGGCACRRRADQVDLPPGFTCGGGPNGADEIWYDGTVDVLNCSTVRPDAETEPHYLSYRNRLRKRSCGGGPAGARAGAARTARPCRAASRA
jgi:hypothetical protein